jgi:hypothetical protein
VNLKCHSPAWVTFPLACPDQALFMCQGAVPMPLLLPSTLHGGLALPCLCSWPCSPPWLQYDSSLLFWSHIQSEPLKGYRPCSPSYHLVLGQSPAESVLSNTQWVNRFRGQGRATGRAGLCSTVETLHVHSGHISQEILWKDFSVFKQSSPH